LSSTRALQIGLAPCLAKALKVLRGHGQHQSEGARDGKVVQFSDMDTA